MPTISLNPCSEAAQSVLSPSRGPRVFVAVHELECDACIRYVRQVVHIQAELASWDGHVAVVGQVCIGTDGALSTLGVPMLEDPDHLLADGRLTVTIADEWGEIYFASESDSLHDGAIAPAEVLEWVKFAAIQCPECEGPEGEWRNL